MAVPSLVMGILSISVPLVLCFLLGIQNIFGLVLGILAIVFAVPSMKKQPEKKGVATGGLVTGIVGTVFSFFGLISWLILWGTVGVGASALGGALKGMDSKSFEDAMKSLDPKILEKTFDDPETQKGLKEMQDALKELEKVNP